MSDVKVEVKSLDDLQPDPNNINKHTQRGHTLVENSIRRRGVFRSVAAAGKNTETPVIYAGNLTHEKAQDAGIKEAIFVHTTGDQLVVVVRDDVEPGSPEAIALGMEDNEAGKQSYNPDLDVAAAVAAGDNALLSELRKQDKVFDSMIERMGIKEERGGDVEPEIDRAEELRVKWGVEPGQLWQLGDHRLICGDCTDRAVVERVMQGEKADLYITDPPYNIGFSAQRNKETYKDTVDNLTGDDYLSLLTGAYENAMSHSEKGVVTCGKQNLKLWMRSFDVSEIGVWIAKNKMSGGKVSSLSLWEPVLFFGKFDRRARANDLFEFNTKFQPEADDHPCPKTLDLWEELIKCFSSETVVDTFLGSGTTLIACENLSRKCRAVEISPAYVAVALERWHVLTGRMPERVK